MYTLRSGPVDRSDVAFYGNTAEFMRCKAPEVIIEGQADTGKTFGALYKLKACACKYPGASIVIARHTYASTVSTVLQTFQNKVLGPNEAKWPCRKIGGERPSCFVFHNGSRIWVAGLDKPGKILSAEHDIIYVNQCEEVSLAAWETLTTRTTGRAGNMPYSQCLGDCNPESKTHWILRRARSGVKPENPLELFHSTHKDNPALYDQKTGEITPEGEKRIGRLSKLTGVRRKRLYLGLWCSPAGAIYEVFDEQKHVVKSFEPSHRWPRMIGLDPYGAYIAAVIGAYDPQEQIINIYDEYVEPFGLSTPVHAQNILNKVDGHIVRYIYGGGPSERQQRLDFQASGLHVQDSRVSNVWAGIDRVNQLLQDFTIVIHDNCEHLISQIGSYRRKVTSDDQVTDTIVNKDDYHSLDALRYLICGLTGTGEDIEREEVIYNPVRIG